MCGAPARVRWPARHRASGYPTRRRAAATPRPARPAPPPIRRPGTAGPTGCSGGLTAPCADPAIKPRRNNNARRKQQPQVGQRWCADEHPTDHIHAGLLPVLECCVRPGQHRGVRGGRVDLLGCGRVPERLATAQRCAYRIGCHLLSAGLALLGVVAQPVADIAQHSRDPPALAPVRGSLCARDRPGAGGGQITRSRCLR